MNKEPAFKTKEAFNVVGIERYTGNGIPAIQEAWDEVSKRFTEIHDLHMPPVAYGVEDYSSDFDMNTGGFPKYYYTAGFEVAEGAAVPQGMKRKQIPEANYAVFDYSGPMSGIHEYFKYIYGEWLPESGYQIDPKLSLDFERYPNKMTDMSNVQMEIWLPVVKK